MLRFKGYIDDEQEQLSESVLGKSFAFIENRKHASNKTKFLSVVSRIQSLAKSGISESDLDKRSNIIFSLFLELGNAMKIQAEMGRNEVNVSTAGVLDMKDFGKELQRVLSGKKT